jgi:hypothetical protein
MKESVKKKSTDNLNEEFVVCLWTNTVHASSIIRAKASQSWTKGFLTITVKSRWTWCIHEIFRNTWKGI